MRRIGKFGGQVSNFLKGNSRSSGSSRGRTQEADEGSSRRAARTPSPEFSNLRSRSNSATSSPARSQSISAASSAASSPVYSRSNSATSSPVRSRPISTVASPTRFDERGRVTDPGHIQFQTSESERARFPEMSEALGHSRLTGPGSPRAERFQVEGYLPDGRYFNVPGVRGPAINAGDDHVIDHRYASHVIDHGEMSDEQAARYIEQQGRPIFPSYETSGYDGSNCVHGHSYTGSNFFEWEIQHHQHAPPQDLAELMRGLRVDQSYSSYRNGNDSDSDS
ncbi:type III effector [Ralstonia solanacearum]|uniref:type III effector n=2 Tax=Ralstonia solanacearum TaxID=305 RepID=UPI001561267F|nr:type III effector [Ralstonia solanacearum]MDB0565361.1 type III effector [Ralstonia solanacearum]MDB0574606.1 type III effector [Ralstonia solanacearum]